MVKLYKKGDYVPLFDGTSLFGRTFSLQAIAGRYVVLFFFATATQPAVEHFLQLIENKLGQHFDDNKFLFVGITIDPNDVTVGRIKNRNPGIHYLVDSDHSISEAYQFIQYDETNVNSALYYQSIFLLNPDLRVLDHVAFDNPGEHIQKLANQIDEINQNKMNVLLSNHAPVLIIPNVFEPELCQRLIQIYEENGGVDSGFMQEKNGLTVSNSNPNLKIRKDFNLQNNSKYTDIIKYINYKIYKILIPEIYKAFHFKVTYIERYLIACYDADTGGYFLPHRDDTTKGTAHRCFAVTMNLNAEEYEGGDLRFGEFGDKTYRAPTGGAVVFGCGLLHEALPVTKGKRYAFLPFLYDDAHEKIRQENLKYLVK